VATEDEGWCSFRSCTPSRWRWLKSHYWQWQTNKQNNTHTATKQTLLKTIPPSLRYHCMGGNEW